MKYTVPGARGDGEVSFSALDAFMGRRFDMAGNFYVQPSLMTTYAKVSSNTFNVGGAAMRIGESEWRYGGEVRVGRDGLLVSASGWTMDAWASGGVWGSDSGGATQFAILALAPPSTGTIFSYGAGVAVKAPKDAVTMRLGAYGQAGAVHSFTIFGGVSMPFGG
jgi:outer membrane autotransporter protein